MLFCAPPRSNVSSRAPKTLLQLDKFLDSYRSCIRNSQAWRPIKVLIIDTGIDILGAPELAGCVEKGKSFVQNTTERGSRESPWFLVSEVHGTQMASLIHDID